MKFFITLCLIASLATLALTTTARWGEYTKGDRLLYYKDVVRSSRYGISWKFVYYPKYGLGGNISYIIVLDRCENNSGAVPYLWGGGPGKRHARIALRGQQNIGTNSTIEIYGRD